MGRSCLSISEGMHLEIRFKKCGISNQPNVCIFDDPCFSKFGALRGSCPHPGRQFVGLLCVCLIVCEEVPLGTPESPPIVSGVSGMRPSDCPNVEETRNPMQTFSWKKCSHFSTTNIPSAFPSEIPRYDLLIILLINIRYVYCDNSFLYRNRYLCEDASRISPMIVSMEFVTLLCSMASI